MAEQTARRTTEAQKRRIKLAFIRAAGAHSIDAARATELMIQGMREAGLTVDVYRAEFVRKFFADMGAEIDRAAGVV